MTLVPSFNTRSNPREKKSLFGRAPQSASAPAPRRSHPKSYIKNIFYSSFLEALLKFVLESKSTKNIGSHRFFTHFCSNEHKRIYFPKQIFIENSFFMRIYFLENIFF